jgi:hypothetical protein
MQRSRSARSHALVPHRRENAPSGARNPWPFAVTPGSAAEEFAKSDSFVVHGVVASWFIKEWNEALAGPDGQAL